jgi:high-affinity iron transporter
MDWSAALPTFVITLREGVEATLVVGIVLAYLSKAKQTHLHRWVYSGAIAGLVASVFVGLGIAWVLPRVATANQVYAPILKPLLEGIFGIVAIAMLSWMLIWMTRQARQLKAAVESAVDNSLQSDAAAGWGIFTLIFFAVLREGFETVVFLAANFQQGVTASVGAITGIIGAVIFGVLLFRLGVKINIRQFFQSMGVFLLAIVGGLVVSALHHFDIAIYRYAQLQNAPLCVFSAPVSSQPNCLLGPQLWDTSQLLPDRQFPGVILHTLFGYPDHLYLLQAMGYVLFLLIIGSLYFLTLKDASAPAAKPAAQPVISQTES